MKNFLSSVTNFIREEEGATAVEYGVLVAAIAAAVIVIITVLGQEIRDAFQTICTKLNGGVACEQ